MNIKKVIKKNENSFTVTMNDSDNILTYPIEENCPICKYIEENKDNGMFEYIEHSLHFNKMQEFDNFLLEKNVDKCEIRLFDNNVIVLALNEYIPEVRRVLSNKIKNGETFEYELRGQKQTIVNIPRSEAVRLFTQIENYDTKLGIYKRYYNNLILEAKTKEELNNIVFQENIVITEQEFVVELLQLDFYLLDGMEIVDTITNNSNEEN